MIQLSEMQSKEVIAMEDGRRMGYISDLEIDSFSGKILAIIILDKEKKSGFFGKGEEVTIYWNQILRIGSDVILVKKVDQPMLTSNVDEQ